MMREAMLYESIKDSKNMRVRCCLCGHRCKISESKFGLCRVRQNKNGRLFTHVYGETIAAHVDPIEKKPLYHFFPGTKSFSVATRGCNFQCGFCQNWQISQSSGEIGSLGGTPAAPRDLVRLARQEQCSSISYTYTEPTIYFEYAYDTAIEAHKHGISNIFVTNGYMTSEALKIIHPYLDAANVDLKSFRDEFYRTTCNGTLEPVLETIRLMRELGVWLEVTTLVVPGLNDEADELREIAGFIAGVDKDIPWHISRFHPDYTITDGGPTPLKTLAEAKTIGLGAGLNYIYVGNVTGEDRNTLCPSCKETVIEREYFSAGKTRVTQDSRCPRCGEKIAGVFV